MFCHFFAYFGASLGSAVFFCPVEGRVVLNHSIRLCPLLGFKNSNISVNWKTELTLRKTPKTGGSPSLPPRAPCPGPHHPPIQYPENLLRLFLTLQVIFFCKVNFRDPPKTPFTTSIKLTFPPRKVIFTL